MLHVCSGIETITDTESYSRPVGTVLPGLLTFGEFEEFNAELNKMQLILVSVIN